MSTSLDINRLRNAVRAARIAWQRHALERMIERHIRRADALEVLLSGELIEEYPEDQPFPSELFLGWTQSRSLHVLAAFDDGHDQVFIITVYKPDLAHFEPNFKTRRAP
jgi:Domain of unknown function (DUF4258)